MNPTPPIPAPEGEVPPRRWYGVRKNGTDWFAPTDKFGGTEYVSKQEVEQLLSAEKQRGLRAVEESQERLMKHVIAKCARLSAEGMLFSENIRIWFDDWKAQASRAAKESS